ncbi:Cytochrome b561 and DOMON domain-containing protein [Heracleum sosnowskyi]|uniref:Cytochrome b561 and DOMON domain-containing protein n=1 Tax=Heracleum sosnowskyi TaxID=360622 RepID=A0AAD8LXS0_9APIA|nr:Cytochrome b561 and DOMON domain-containing protein [Heracleum sosnowskyi]
MASTHLSILLLISLSLFSVSQSLTCTSQKFINNKLYQHRNNLPQLNSYLHYTYDAKKSSLSIAFVATPPKPNGWVSWAINPTTTGMKGSQALIGFKNLDGSVVVKTYNINSYGPLVESELSFEVTQKSCEFFDEVFKIFATVVLPEMGNETTLNQVWQVGASVTGGVPDKHEFQPQNLNSKGTLDFLSGQTSAGGGGDRHRRKNIHGVLNAVSWGILFPVGIIIARYMRTFPSTDPTWFYLHVFCQVSAYAIGVAGWGTGLKLGSQSKGVKYSGHRNIGIALFVLATVQVFALFFRPKKDHKYKFHWSVYHHGLGYAIVILGIINVFKGLDILDPEEKWKRAYIGVIVALGVIDVILEAITWIMVSKRKSGSSTKPYNGEHNGSGRQQPLSQ